MTTPRYMLWASLVLQSKAYASLPVMERLDLRDLLTKHQSLPELSEEIFKLGTAMIKTGPDRGVDPVLFENAGEFSQGDDPDA